MKDTDKCRFVLDFEEPSNLLQQRWRKLGTCSERTHRIRWIEVTSSRCRGGGRDVEQARSGLWFGAAEYSSWSFAEVVIAFGRRGRDVEQGAHDSCSLLTQAIVAEQRLAYMSFYLKKLVTRCLALGSFTFCRR